jgi:large subunit ribosomal protein L11
MSKSLLHSVKLQLKGGEATPAPPVGTALGQRGVNIMGFVKQFNDATSSMKGVPINVVVNVYSDKSFNLIFKGASTSALIKKLLNISAGAKNPGKEVIKSISINDLMPIAVEKMEFFNCYSPHQALLIVAGTAKSMGIEILKN